jgi:hypothetical protein
MRRFVLVLLFLSGLLVKIHSREKTDFSYLVREDIPKSPSVSFLLSEVKVLGNYPNYKGSICLVRILNIGNIIDNNIDFEFDVKVFSGSIDAGPSGKGFSIRPKTVSGFLNTSYKWTASHTGTQSGIKYEWDFGDGSGKETKQNDSNITHTYNKPGSYKIKLICYDNKNSKIGNASANVKIGKEITKTNKTSTLPPRKKMPAEIKYDTLVIFDNWNISGVSNNPENPTEFTIDKTYYVTSIQNYHWNNRQGDLPGSIGLKKGEILIGNWKVIKATPGQGGVPNVNWICYPNMVIQPGKYSIIDSNPKTWSHNYKSRNSGFSRVSGYARY